MSEPRCVDHPLKSTPLTREMAPLLLLLAMVAWIYAPVPGMGFLNWDDPVYIAANDMVAKGLTWQGVVWSFTNQHPFVQTLTWLSFMAEVSLAGGVNPWLCHMDNLILHLINIGFVYLLVRTLTGRPGVALVVAGLMGLHPQHVEVVVWITERKELLACLFGLGTIFSYVKYLACPTQGSFWRLIAIGSFLLSLLSKPQWVPLPFLLLLLDHWPLGRQHLGWGRLLLEKWPFFLLSVLFSAVTILSYANDDRLFSLAQHSLDYRFLNSVYGLFGQLGKSFWPVDLAILYPPVADSITPAQVWWRGGGLLLITLAVWATRRSKPHLAVGWLWFLVALFPTLGLVNGGVVVVMADRWSYLPHLGLFLTLAHEGHQWFGHRRKAAMVGVVTLFLLLGLVTNRQIFHWRDNISLWQHTIEATQPWPNPHAHWLLGALYREDQRITEAIQQMAEAWRLKPYDPNYVQSLAQLYLQQGETEKGYQLLYSLLTLPATSRVMLMMVASGMVFDKNYQDALKFLGKALENPPDHADADYADALFLTSLALIGTQDTKQGVEVLTFFIERDPQLKASHCQKALATFEKTAADYPEFAPLHRLAQGLCPRT